MIKRVILSLIVLSALIALPFVNASQVERESETVKLKLVTIVIEAPVAFFLNNGYDLKRVGKSAAVLSAAEADALIQAAQDHPRVNLIFGTCNATSPGVVTFFTPHIAFNLGLDNLHTGNVDTIEVTANLQSPRNGKTNQCKALVLQDKAALLLTSWPSPANSRQKGKWARVAVVRVSQTGD